MQKPQFVKEYIYHIYNRGVEKRKTFLDDADRLRFIHDLFEMNDEAPAGNVLYYFDPQSMEVQPQYIPQERKPRKLLVEILAFVLMPNHFHLLLRQKKEKGIIRFMQKFGTAYTMYFNKKYTRVGGLFQGRYKAVIVQEQAHFTYIPFYIHANPVELMIGKSIYGGSTSIDWKKVMRFLEEYRWSSFPDYIGRKNFPSLTSRDFLSDYFGGAQAIRKDMQKLLQDRENTSKDLNDMRTVLFD